ncbi:MAG TPA: hypothetical protein VLW75_03370 [Rhizomicrobium sp.]|nr:hypothetical protein [Rhizomicrobium sp.]
MSDTKIVDISKLRFASTSFPTAEDRALWDSLSAAERLAIVERDEEAGFRSGVARNSSLREILAEIRSPARK